MTPWLVISSVVLSLLVSALGVLAQAPSEKVKTARFGNPTSIARIYQDYLHGVIKKVDETELVLDKTKFGIEQTIRLDPKTKFIRDGKASSLGDLKIGEDVYVETRKDKKTGQMMAKKVVTGAVTMGP